jgi:hypothetical protein
VKRRLWLGAAGLGSWIAAVAVKDVLRPKATAAAPAVLLVLGSAPSLLAAMGVPLLLLFVHPAPTHRNVRNACLLAAGLATLAEWIERYLPGPVPDWHDWVASMIGVALAAVAAWLILRPDSRGSTP